MALSDEERQRKVAERVRQETLARLHQENQNRPTFERDIRSGVRRISAVGPSVQSFAAGLRNDDAEVERQALRARRVQEEALAIQPDVPRASEITSPTQIPAYVVRSLVQQGPNFAAIAGGAALGGVIGRGAGVRRGVEIARRLTQAGAVTGAATTSAGVQTTENIPDLVLDPEARKRHSPSELARRGGAAAAAGGALDAIPAAGILNRLGLSRNARRLASGGFSPKRVAIAAGSQATREGTTELAQQGIQLGTLRFARDNFDALTGEELRELFDAFAAGFSVGGVLGGGSQAAGDFAQSRFRQRLENRRADRELGEFLTSRGVVAQRSASDEFSTADVERLIDSILPQDHPIRQASATELNDTISVIRAASRGEDLTDEQFAAVERNLGPDVAEGLLRMADPEQQLRLAGGGEQIFEESPDTQREFTFEEGTAQPRVIKEGLQGRALSERLSGKQFESSSLEKRLDELRNQHIEKRRAELSTPQELRRPDGRVIRTESAPQSEIDEILAAEADRFQARPVTERLGGDPQAAARFARQRIKDNPKLEEAFDPDNPTAFTDQFFDIVENRPADVFQATPEFEFTGKRKDVLKAPKRGFKNAIPVTVNGKKRMLLANRLASKTDTRFIDQAKKRAEGKRRVGQKFATALASFVEQNPDVQLPDALDPNLEIGALQLENGEKVDVFVRDIPKRSFFNTLKTAQQISNSVGESTQVDTSIRGIIRTIQRDPEGAAKLESLRDEANSKAIDAALQLHEQARTQNFEPLKDEAEPGETQVVPIEAREPNKEGTLEEERETRDIEGRLSPEEAKEPISDEVARRDELANQRRRQAVKRAAERRAELRRQVRPKTEPKTAKYSALNAIPELARLAGRTKKLTIADARKLAKQWLNQMGLSTANLRIKTPDEARADVNKFLDKGVPEDFSSPDSLFYMSLRNASEGVEQGNINGALAYHTTRKFFTIVIDPENQSGPDAISALTHELGHFIFRSVETDADTAKAIKAEFDRWRAQRRSTESVDEALSSFFSPVRLMQRFRAASSDQTFARLSESEQTYYLDFEEWFAENVSRWMTTSAKPLSTVDKFFSGLAETLRKFWEVLKNAGFVKGDLRTPASVEKLMNDLFDKRQSYNNALTRQSIAERFGLDRDDSTVLSMASQQGASLAEHHELINQFASKLTQQQFGDLVRIFHNSAVRTRLLDKLREQAPPGVVPIAANDPLAAAAYGYQLWQRGELELSNKATSLFQKIKGGADQAMGKLMDSKDAEDKLTEISQVLAGLHRESDKTLELKPPPAKQMVQRLVGYAEKMGSLMRSLYTSQGSIYATKNPALISLSNKIQVRVGEELRGEAYVPAKNRQFGHWLRRVDEATATLDEEQGRELAEALLNPELAITDPEIKKAKAAVRKIFDGLFRYLSKAGVDVEYRKDYFPWTIDVSALIENKAEFIRMLSQEKFAKDLLASPLAPNNATEQNFDQAAREKVVNKLYADLIRQDGFVDANPDMSKGFTPHLRQINQRLLGFVEAKGNAQDKATLNKLLDRNIGVTMVKYIEQATKRAEFTRKFGSEGELINKAIEDAKATGASEKDIRDFQAHLSAMFGTMGAEEFHPLIKRTLKAWDGFFNTELADRHPREFRRYQGMMLVFQNIRTLGLATLTSLSDSAGIIGRAESPDVAWESLRAGIKEAVALLKGDKTELSRLAHDLGIVEHHLANKALGEAYGGVLLTGRAKQFNEKFFRLIGLQQWTQGTRFMAMAGARRFLAKHAERAEKGDAKSKRFLNQLSVTPTDILLENGEVKVLTQAEREAASEEELARDERVRGAINQYVDEAVIRPNAAQRPSFLSHPDMMLIAHLKQYQFSIYDRLLRRVGSEIKEGNYWALTMPVSAAVIMLASELLRDEIQFGEDGDPRKKNWGFREWLHHVNQRAGLYGYGGFLVDARRDRQFGGLGIESFAGPSAQWTKDFMEVTTGLAIPGADHNELKKRERFLVKSLPANSIYRNWDYTSSHEETARELDRWVQER